MKLPKGPDNLAKISNEPVSRKRAMVQQALGGYLNTGIAIIQGILLVPIYLHYLGPHIYGLWLASSGVLAMLGVMNLGVGNFLIQRVAEAYGRSDLRKAGDYFINGAAIYTVLSLLIIGAGFLLSFGLPILLKEEGAAETLLRQCFQLAVVAVSLALFNECLRSFAQAMLSPLYSALALAGSRITGLSVTVFLLVVYDDGLWAIPTGMMVAEVVALLFGIIHAARLFRRLQARVGLNIELLKEYAASGSLLFASRLGHALSREADPLLITMFFKPEMTAAYMVTRKAAEIVFQLLSSVCASAFGAFSHLAGTGHGTKTGIVAAQLLLLTFLAGLVGFASYVALNANFVGLWVGRVFALDQNAILLIGLAYFLNSLRNMVLQLLNGLGEFNRSSRLVLAEGLIKTGLTICFLNWMGVHGAPLAMIVACAVMLMVLSVGLFRKIYLPIPLRAWIGVLSTPLLLFGLGNLFSNYFTVESWVQFCIYTIIWTLVATFVAMFLNFRFVKSLTTAHRFNK